jgi:hypothetical protein
MTITRTPTPATGTPPMRETSPQRATTPSHRQLVPTLELAWRRVEGRLTCQWTAVSNIEPTASAKRADAA